MLEKTRNLLAQYAAGTYVADDTACYDETEIQEFGQAMASLVYAPSKLRKKLQSLGVTITRSDFYSEIPTVADIEDSFVRKNPLKLEHPFRDTAFLRRFLQELIEFGSDFDPPRIASRDDEFGWEGSGAFSYCDAMAYYCMIRRCRPKTIVEIGCGASTLIASLACERNGVGRIIAIEPYPVPYLERLPRVDLVRKRAQDLDDEFINKQLEDGDILFIDSTHTVKHDSDCLHIYLRILPHIASKIFVHVHDVFLPDTLPIEFLRDHQLFWNEQYLVYMYLIGHSRAQVLYGSAYHHGTNPDLLAGLMRGRYSEGGLSLWFEQSGPVSS